MHDTRRHDDDVVALQQRARGGVAHAVDLLVHRRFLLDVGVGARHVGFGLVVVVVGDEVLHRVVGEEALELAVELGGQRLVGRQHQGRALGRRDHLRGGEGLARAGDAEQHLVALVLVDARDQLGDGGGLVALGLVLRHQLEGDAALGLLGALGPVRDELRQAARHQRMRGDHRLLGQHLARALGALVRLGEDGVERRRHALDAARGRPDLAQRGEGGRARRAGTAPAAPRRSPARWNAASPACRRRPLRAGGTACRTCRARGGGAGWCRGRRAGRAFTRGRGVGGFRGAGHGGYMARERRGGKLGAGTLTYLLTNGGNRLGATSGTAMHIGSDLAAVVIYTAD